MFLNVFKLCTFFNDECYIIVTSTPYLIRTSLNHVFMELKRIVNRHEMQMIRCVEVSTIPSWQVFVLFAENRS